MRLQWTLCCVRAPAWRVFGGQLTAVQCSGSERSAQDADRPWIVSGNPVGQQLESFDVARRRRDSAAVATQRRCGERPAAGFGRPDAVRNFISRFKTLFRNRLQVFVCINAIRNRHRHRV